MSFLNLENIFPFFFKPKAETENEVQVENKVETDFDVPLNIHRSYSASDHLDWDEEFKINIEDSENCQFVGSKKTGYKLVDSYGEPFLIFDSEIFFNELKTINGVSFGVHCSHYYRLNENGIPVAHGEWDSEIHDIVDSQEILPLGESNYFSDCADAGTFKVAIAAIKHRQVYRIYHSNGMASNICVMKNKDEALYKVIDRKTKEQILDENNKPFEYHEIFFRKGIWIGTKGAGSWELDDVGKKVKELPIDFL